MNLKERIKNGETVLGIFNSIASPSLINVLGVSGLDFVVIDAEHGPINMETAEDLVRAADVTGMAPIIRVPEISSHRILRALDIGAQGIQVPHVATKRDAEKVVEYAKYHPIGDRGYSPFTRAGKYGLDAENHPERENERTLIVVIIEGVEGLENLKEIIEVPHIDVIFIGPYDLSQSLGIPGQVNDERVIEAVKTNVAFLKEKGIACGSYARDLDYLDILLECGVQYITYSVDSTEILNMYKELHETFKKKLKG